MPPTPLVRPQRSAHAAIRGYLYQTCLGVVRWLDLQDDETLVVEGDEDLDRFLLDGTGVSEQVKDYAGRVNVRDRAVRDSLRAFAVAFATLRQDDGDRRFLFTTTAEKRPQRRGTFDVIEAWDDPQRKDDVVAELREILPKKDDKDVAKALVWLDADPGRWKDFVDAVDFRFEEKKLDDVRRQVDTKLRGRGLRPTQAHVDRLVAELLRASSQDDVALRTRTSQDLDDLLRTIDDELVRWSATPQATHLRAVFDEVADIGRLLHDGTRPLRDDPTPGHLLTAAHEVVPFHAGRDAELAELAAWCSDDRPAGVWLWTGEGGVGKTRLMIEWCRRLRAQGWHAGFLHRHLDDGPGRLAKGTAPRLVVVDYAETRLDVVRPLLYKVASSSGARCRVVLLARREADWWRLLRQEDAVVDELIDASPAPRELAVLDAARAAAFRDAATAFAQVAFTQIQMADAGEPSVPDLDDFDRVLYLHMAALAAVGGERIEDARDALAKTLDHERHFWSREADGLGLDGSLTQHLKDTVGPALAALTLVGGTSDPDETRRLVEHVTEVSAPRVDLGKTLLRFLWRAYGSSDGAYLGLEPDLLGEELVASYLAEDATLLDRVLEATGDDGRAAALTVLTRLARRRPEEERWLARAFEGHLEALAEAALTVAVEIGDPVGQVLAGFVGGESGELAERLMKRCNREDYTQSVPLREVACEATRRRLEVCRESWPEPDEDQLKELSRVAMHLGRRFSDLGRREDALEATREAVETYRQLASSRPDAFLPGLAGSLNNLGKMLSDLGRREDALEVTREAVEIRRQLAASRPDAFLPGLAQSLNNLGSDLSDLGRREDALEATREAVEIQRQDDELLRPILEGLGRPDEDDSGWQADRRPGPADGRDGSWLGGG